MYIQSQGSNSDFFVKISLSLSDQPFNHILSKGQRGKTTNYEGTKLLYLNIFAMPLLFESKPQYVMIPCKIFLEKVTTQPENCKLQISLSLNSIFYDQIKPFQTRYFCLSSHDVISVEACENHDIILGTVEIVSPFRLALNNETAELTIQNKQAHSQIKSIHISLSLAPVASYSRKKLGVSTKHLNLAPLKETERSEYMKNEQLEISFSNRDPLQETQNMMNFPQLFPPKDDSFSESFRSADQNGDSLESLAQQREKILGELFGKFKRDR